MSTQAQFPIFPTLHETVVGYQSLIDATPAANVPQIVALVIQLKRLQNESQWNRRYDHLAHKAFKAPEATNDAHANMVEVIQYLRKRHLLCTDPAIKATLADKLQVIIAAEYTRLGIVDQQREPTYLHPVLRRDMFPNQPIQAPTATIVQPAPVPEPRSYLIR